jgi:heme/copper-type cytochrome/quinol oxidase subunit 4
MSFFLLSSKIHSIQVKSLLLIHANKFHASLVKHLLIFVFNIIFTFLNFMYQAELETSNNI